MEISAVLAIHNSHQAEFSHSDILGDAFLMRSNSVYLNIKRFAVKIGCKYAEAWPQYLLLPFHELGKIVATKTIPYVPSGRMLQELENKRPGALTTDDLKMPESYHLHEAAHVIADHLFAGVRVEKPQEKILKAILCESFANTVDALACVPAVNETHRYFLEHNCYMHPDPENMGIMSRLTTGLGERCVFMLTLFAYVNANFLRETFSPDLVKELAQRYAPGRELSPELIKDCEALGEMGEKLDPQFRVQTTQMYLKMEGYDGEIFELLNFPYLKIFAVRPEFRAVTEAMADVLTPT